MSYNSINLGQMVRVSQQDGEKTEVFRIVRSPCKNGDEEKECPSALGDLQTLHEAEEHHHEEEGITEGKEEIKGNDTGEIKVPSSRAQGFDDRREGGRGIEECHIRNPWSSGDNLQLGKTKWPGIDQERGEEEGECYDDRRYPPGYPAGESRYAL